jgi:hypothetical protein
VVDAVDGCEILHQFGWFKAFFNTGINHLSTGDSDFAGPSSTVSLSIFWFFLGPLFLCSSFALWASQWLTPQRLETAEIPTEDAWDRSNDFWNGWMVSRGGKELLNLEILEEIPFLWLSFEITLRVQDLKLVFVQCL